MDGNDIPGLTLEILLDRVKFIDTMIEIHEDFLKDFVNDMMEVGECDYILTQIHHLKSCIGEDKQIKNMLLAPVSEKELHND